MSALTVIYIILAGIIALGASFYFYLKSTQNRLVRIALLGLRFTVLFAVILLIINPQFSQRTYTTEKPVLAIAVDNSQSLSYLEGESVAQSLLKRLRENPALTDRFDLDFYSFGEDLQRLDSLNFDAPQTDVAKVLTKLNTIYRFNNYVPLIITDGNSTLGEDYGYVGQSLKKPTFAFAIGDTATYADLAVHQVNANKYAYVSNDFPVEVLVRYTGKQSLDAKLELLQNNKVIASKNISVSESQPSAIKTFYLRARKVGVNTFTARVVSKLAEKNVANNSRDFAVEVIDQKSKVLVLYATLHPDLGTLKKSIESNPLRSVVLQPVNEALGDLTAYDLIIFYEPNQSFSNAFKEVENLDKNTITLVGRHADLQFINRSQSLFTLDSPGGYDEAQPALNPAFSAFALGDLNFKNMPPLISPFGEIKFNGAHETLLFKQIAQVVTKVPLLAISDDQDKRQIIIFGTDIWKWRAQSYLNNGNFKAFDDFANRLVQYAALQDTRERLKLDFETVYYGNSQAVMRASYFDKNYNPDLSKNLQIVLRPEDGRESIQLPLIAAGGRYTVNFSTLEPGNYDFTVKVKGEPIARSGTFAIIAFNAEEQFKSANWASLYKLAESTAGQALLPSEVDRLIDTLTTENRYVPIQRSSIKNVPLLSYKVLLFIIAACLAAEWFIRKYNGLI